MKLWKYLKNKMQLNPQQEICENGVSMTFKEMIVFAEEFSKKLKGIKCCAILCQSEMAAGMALLSCFAAGVTALPLSQRYGEIHCNKILDAINPDAVITDQDGDFQIIYIKDSVYKEPSIHPTLIMCTSATTGVPKGAMLTEDEYISIVMMMSKCVPIQSQTNYYFDNDDLAMNEKGITCRIRVRNGKYKATVKNHNLEHPDCSFEVVLVEKTEFDPQIFNAFGLHHQGEIITDRAVIHKDSTCEMVLDRNVYLGHTDFELEVEYCDGSEAKAQALIENIAEYLVSTKLLTGIDELLARVGQGGYKSQRFFERLKDCK